jgi:hypothetical protein
MDNVVPFKKPATAKQGKGHTLCRNGHHKWKLLSARKFDVKQGRLVTAYECERCGKKKVVAL